MFPIRCFSCGKILRDIKHVQTLNPKERIQFFKKNNITKTCCKMRYLTSVDIFSVELEFSETQQ